MKVPKGNFLVLGQKSQTYKRIDLSIDGAIANELHQTEKKFDWYAYLHDLPETEPSFIYHGGYLEKRFFYSNEQLFGKGKERRNIHLGVDLWVSVDTPIFAPFDGIVQSIHYNDSELDYGHTIILKHEIGDQIFYSLYGHLSSSHVHKLKANDHLEKGQEFCSIGAHAENGGWPPHLHLQLIQDLEDHIGDYPGVCSLSKLEFYKKNCPDPSHLIFR